MPDKNFEFYQKESSSTYGQLNIVTKPTICVTDNNIGDNADLAMANIGNLISGLGFVQVKVVDQQNRPVKGALVKGFRLNAYTNDDGVVSGEIGSSSVITVESPYVDLVDASTTISSSVDIFHPIRVVLPSIDDNSILTYTTSKKVEFSQGVDTIDICCVGGGGAGGSYKTSGTSDTYGSGGGGGGIVNKMAYSPFAGIEYSIVVGSGGTYPAGAGGYTSFAGAGGNIVYAAGGNGGGIDVAGGTAGVSGCGNGGYKNNGGNNTTISRFNDGVTFYSGGGGSGFATSVGPYPNYTTKYTGGSPNGANGAFTYSLRGSPDVIRTVATAAGIGGGGGGGARAVYASTDPVAGSSGGDGAVFIRVHLK